MSNRSFIKDLLLSPSKTVTNVLKSHNEKFIVIVFILSLSIPFFRSFFILPAGKEMISPFSDNTLYYLWLKLAQYPIVNLLFCLVGYIFMMIIVHLFMNFSKNEIKFKTLLLGLTSLGLIGIIARVSMIFINFLSLGGVRIIIFYIFYLWVILYTLFLIRNIYSVSWWRTISVFLLIFICFVPFFGLLCVAPYLIWL